MKKVIYLLMTLGVVSPVETQAQDHEQSPGVSLIQAVQAQIAYTYYCQEQLGGNGAYISAQNQARKLYGQMGMNDSQLTDMLGKFEKKLQKDCSDMRSCRDKILNSNSKIQEQDVNEACLELISEARNGIEINAAKLGIQK